MLSSPFAPLLAHLSPDERSFLLDRAVPRRLQPGAFIHLSGESSPRVHLVSAGLVKLTARDADGRETILGLAVAGDILGDAAAIEGIPQVTDAVAVTKCSVVGFDSALLLDVLRRNPSAALSWRGGWPAGSDGSARPRWSARAPPHRLASPAAFSTLPT